MKTVPVFFPVGDQYYLQSCWVEVNGKRSFQPPTGQPQFKEKSYVEAEVQKGNAVIDNSMAMPEAFGSKRSAKMEGAAAPKGNGIRGAEKNQMAFTLTEATDATGYARLGWTALTGLYDSSVIKGANSVVGGKFTTSVLTYIGYLLSYGVVKFSKIQFNGTADAVFETVQPLYKKFNSLGEVILERYVDYPPPASTDQDTTIRVMDEKWFADQGVTLDFDGLSYFQLAVPKDQTLAATIWFDFIPNA